MTRATQEAVRTPQTRGYTSFDESITNPFCLTEGKKVWIYNDAEDNQSIVPMLVMEVNPLSGDLTAFDVKLYGMREGEYAYIYINRETWGIRYFPSFQSALLAACLNEGALKGGESDCDD